MNAPTQKPIRHVIGNVTSTRLAQPFDVYRVQNAQQMADDPELDAFIDTIGAGEFLRKKRLANHILKRIDNQLHMINK